MATEARTVSAIDADLVAVRAAKAHLMFAPPSGDRATQRQTLEARERELVAEREVAAEEAVASKIVGLHKKHASLEGSVEKARAAAEAARQAYTTAHIAMNVAWGELERANREVEQRVRAVESLEREIEYAQRAEASKPESIRAAAEAALAILKFAPIDTPRAFKTSRYRRLDRDLDESVPREALDAIVRYLQIAPRDERQDFENRYRALAAESARESRREAQEATLAAQRENERRTIERNDAARVEREAREAAARPRPLA